MRRTTTVALCVAVALTACATDKASFYNSPSSVGDWSLCRTWSDASNAGDLAFVGDVAREAAARGMTSEGCRAKNLVVEVGAVTIVVLGVVAAALAARGGGGGGGVTDTTWAWDQFRAQDGSMLWACRGKQTGQFADQWRCSGLPMNDLTWPGP